MLQDVRYAWRQLRKSPGFALTAVLTLAIGIGANTAMFSLMDAIVLRPLAVPDLHRVLTVDEQQSNGQYTSAALANYEDWQRQSHSFESLAVRTQTSMSLTGAGEAAHVQASLVSANFFDVLRAEPLMGRVFAPGECKPGSDAEAVLYYGLWKKHFGGDPNIIGRAVELDGRSYRVIGVMPKTVQYPSDTDVFLPFAPTPQQMQDRSTHGYLVTGRLRRGVSAKQAQAELDGIAARLARIYPATNLGRTVHTEALLDGINGPYTNQYMKMILGATLFVLLVVCANVANLQFARGLARRPEIAMRTALGAGRGRILRQLMTESVMLSLAGAIAGIFFAMADLHLNVAVMPDRVARYMAGWSNISLNGATLAWSLMLAVGAGLVAGILPALEALRVNLVDQLKSGSRTASGGRRNHRLRNVFAAAQIALAVALVVGAALMAKGTWGTLHFGDRYEPQRVLTFTVHLPHARYDTPQTLNGWYDASLARLRALPGVQQAEITSTMPWGDYPWTDEFHIEGRPLAPGKFQSAARLTVSPGYLTEMHIPLEAGRAFTGSDGLTTEPVALVTRSFARRYFPGDNAVGHRIQVSAIGSGPAPWVRIVGVTGEASYEWGEQSGSPAVMLDAQQGPLGAARYVIVTAGNPLAVANAARQALAGIDPQIPLDGVQTYQQMLSDAFCGLFYAEGMLGFDAAIALLLAAIGIFAVMANLVAERMREIGVRLALGARREDVLRAMLQRAGVLTGIGLAIGLLMAAALARLVASLLVGVRANDPVVFGGITVAVVAIALAASWIPARRAAGVDPMVALRDE